MNFKLTFYIFSLGFACLACNQTPKASNNVFVKNDTVEIVIQPAVITDTTLNDTDDPAIWVNRNDPSKSLILGTDKGDSTGGIFVFNLDGKLDRAKSIYNLKRPNNIDIEYGFEYKGKKIDIAVFTERIRNMIRIISLPDMKFIDGGGIEVFMGDSLRAPMGVSLYKDTKKKKVYAIVGRKTGPDGSYLWQYELKADKGGAVVGKKVREFGHFSGKKEIEAIAVDDTLGYVYYSDETFGVRQYYASPDSGNRELALFANTGITGDQEGLSIYYSSRSTGFIIVSDQQANKFHIFRREGNAQNPFGHAFVKIVKVAAMESDGSEVSALPLNNLFPRGLFVAMSNNKTFHFYNWEDFMGK
jgi:3-phytase